MRLLFAIKSLSVAGGAERVFSQIVNGLSRKGHEICVATFDELQAKAFYPLQEDVLWIKHGGTGATAPTRIYHVLPRVFFLRRIMLQFLPDANVGFLSSMYIHCALASLGTGIPVVASEHALWQRHRSSLFESTLQRAVVKCVSEMVVVSQHARESFPPSMRKHQCVIENPMEFGGVARSNVRGTANQRKRLITVGRLVASKDVATLIEAFALLAKEFPSWELRVIGEGPLMRELIARVHELGLTNQVLLLGSVPSISAEYSRAQLFVTASRFESFGLAVYEALAHGLPVLGFADSPGIRDAVRSFENGILVSSQDRVLSLAKELRRLMLSDEERLKLVQKEFDPPDQCTLGEVLAKWETLLGRITVCRHA